MFVTGVVCVRLVVHINGSRSIHFRRKLQRLISKKKRSLQSEKIPTQMRKRWMVSALRYARFSYGR